MTDFTLIPAGANRVLVRPKTKEMIKITTVPTGRLVFQGITDGSPVRLPPLEAGETLTCEVV